MEIYCTHYREGSYVISAWGVRETVFDKYWESSRDFVLVESDKEPRKIDYYSISTAFSYSLEHFISSGV